MTRSGLTTKYVPVPCVGGRVAIQSKVRWINIGSQMVSRYIVFYLYQLFSLWHNLRTYIYWRIRMMDAMLFLIIHNDRSSCFFGNDWWYISAHDSYFFFKLSPLSLIPLLHIFTKIMIKTIILLTTIFLTWHFSIVLQIISAHDDNTMC